MSGPVQVITLTPNPAIDQTIRLERLVPGSVHRALGQQLEAGGKGIGVAAVLAALGVPVAAGGWLGADNPGLFHRAFAQHGIVDLMAQVPGATRTNIKLADASRPDGTDINLPGIRFDAEELARAEAALLARLAVHLRPGVWVELAGSLPPGVGTDSLVRLADAVRAQGARLMLDTGGAAMRELLGLLRPGPDFIKPNRAELEELVGRPLADVAAVADAAQALQRQGVRQLVVSLGGEGAVIVDGRGRWFAEPPRVPVATTVGAGDALVAGTLAVVLEGERGRAGGAGRPARPFHEAARFGMACAAARIQQVAPGLPPRAEIDALAARIRLQPV